VDTCVVCAGPTLGHVNGVGFCLAHVDAVIGRVLRPARLLLHQLLGRTE
jgi:hypothetical protein